MKLAGMLNERSRRVARVLLPIAVFLALATIIAPRPPLQPAGPAVGAMTAAPISLEVGDAGRARVGALIFLRGWVLDSEDPRFGGISAMHVDGGEAIAISDSGTVLRFALPRSAGSGRLRVERLRTGHWSPRHPDAEAMLVHDGKALIAFESRNVVARYGISDWREEQAARPPPMQLWRRNSGPEAMVRLADGRFLVFAEGRRDESPSSPVLLFDGDPSQAGARAVELRYRRPAGFRITDAAQLPDGRLLLLNRRAVWLGGFSAKLVIAEAHRLRAGATIAGRTIAELRSPLTVDNMEALSVTREGGRTIVRIASDNNFTAIQRTLLLEFALVEPGS